MHWGGTETNQERFVDICKSRKVYKQWILDMSTGSVVYALCVKLFQIQD